MEPLADLTAAEEAWLLTYVAEQTKAYANVLSPSALAEMRAALALTLAVDPDTRELVRRMTPPPVVFRSEELPLGDGASSDPREATNTKARGEK